MLFEIVNKYGNKNSNLSELRIACMSLLSYAGFLRFSELANLKRSNITIYSDHVKLVLEQSKTDVYREGRDVVISKTGNITCPVNMLIRYLDIAKIPENSSEFIFRSVSFCSCSKLYKLRKNCPLSYYIEQEKYC